MSELFEAIEVSFRKAISNTSYRSISVKDLCEDANVSRKAFYNEFDGRTDVLRRIFDRDVVHPAVELCSLLSFERMSKYAKEMEKHMFEAVRNDGEFYRDVVLAPMGGEEAFLRATKQSFHEFNLFLLDEFGYSGDSHRTEAIASFFALGKAGYIVEWIKAGYDPSAEEASAVLSTMVLPFWRSLR